MSHRLWPSAITTLLLALGTTPALADENPRRSPELLPPPKCCGVADDCCAQVKGAEAHSGIAPCCAKGPCAACSEEQFAVAASIAPCAIWDVMVTAMEMNLGPAYCLRQLCDDDCCAAHAGACCVSPASAKARTAGPCAAGCCAEVADCRPRVEHPMHAIMIGAPPCVPAIPPGVPVFAPPPMMPVGPWSMPVAMPAPPMPCAVPAPAIIRPSLTIRAEEADSKHLTIIMDGCPTPMGTVQVACPQSDSCDKMLLKLLRDHELHVCAKGNQVEVQGPSFHAVADAVMVSGQYGAVYEKKGYNYLCTYPGLIGPGLIGGKGHPVLVLDGHVRLCSHREEGADTHVASDHLVVGVHGAQVEISLSWTMEPMPGTD